MSKDVNINLTLNDTVTPQLQQIRTFARETGKEVMDVKRESLKHLQETRSAAIRTMTGVRLMFYAFGGALDPFMQAVLNILGSSIETLYALATAEGSTILGLPAAAVHGLIATSIEAVTLPMILKGIDDAQTAANRALAALDAFTIFGGLV